MGMQDVGKITLAQKKGGKEDTVPVESMHFSCTKCGKQIPRSAGVCKKKNQLVCKLCYGEKGEG
jgi:predicted RNA-binding Zn-ribbon protein involved in translation (DUF1610 family)